METQTDSPKREKHFEITLYKDKVGFHSFYVEATTRFEASQKAREMAANPNYYWISAKKLKMTRQMQRQNINEMLITFF